MSVNLSARFQEFAAKAFADPENLSPEGNAALERAFYAGAWAALSETPALNPGQAQAVADRLKEADLLNDELRQQCGAVLAHYETAPTPRVPRVRVPAAPEPVPSPAQDPAPAPAPGPSAETADAPPPA